jgi:8-oxo-dGTP diphosphatase
VPTPDYILKLRRYVGHDRLLLLGVSGVVVRAVDQGESILLQRRSDTGRWALPSGIVEPDEHPATTVEREILEETGIQAQVERLALLSVDPEIVYPNGDRCQFVAMTFRCSYLGGEAQVADEESVDVGWFTTIAMPELEQRYRRRIECAVGPAGPTILDR